jgi:hypothetical protein
MRSKNLLPALFLGLAAFVAYALTAAPDLLYGDAGEFQFTLPLAGVGHPTGYPLFHILGWGWERFFGSNPAWGANLFSALWGGVAVAAFYLFSAEALARLRARLKWPSGERWLAGLATIIFALNPTLWAQATQAEVYTLHAAFVAAILGATLAAARERDAWPLWPVALLLGLSLTHHLTTVFLIPGVALFLLLPGVVGIIRLHPFELAYYNGLVGGPRGAKRLGFETIYFASTYGAFLPQLNALPPESRVWVMPNSYDVLYYYQLNGLLRPDLVMLRPPGWGSFYDDAGVNRAEGWIDQADVALIERRQTAFNRELPNHDRILWWAEHAPELARLERAGVTLATLHSKP